MREGEYVSNLTRDDLGAFRYLLDTNNINEEACLPTVRAADGSTNFVHFAARPGVDKITFVRHDPADMPITNFFFDVYIENGERKSQSLQRLIETPDILFTAENHPRQNGYPPAIVRRTPPNFSHQNDTGSGILQPEVVISFQKLGDIYREPLLSDGVESIDDRWSVFDSRTVTPSPIFPVGPAYQGGRTLAVRQVEGANGAASVEWKLRLIAGVQYAIESSSDLVRWTDLTNIIALPIHTLTNGTAVDSAAVFWRARRISQ